VSEPNKERDFLRGKKSEPYWERILPLEFIEFVDAECLPRLGFKGYKLEEKYRIARQVLYNLIHLGLLNKTVNDSRTLSETSRIRLQVWDSMVANNMARMVTGSELGQRNTLYYPTDWLFERQKLWNLGLLRHTSEDEGPLAIVKLKETKRLLGPERRVKGKVVKGMMRKVTKSVECSVNDYLVTLEEACKREPKPKNQELYKLVNGGDFTEKARNYVIGIEKRLLTVNDFNAQHSFTVLRPTEVPTTDGKRPLIRVQLSTRLRVQYSQTVFYYGRLYTHGPGGAQNASKEQRTTMKIDREPAAELDFSGFHTRILYHLANLDPKGDVYQTERIFPKLWSFENSSKELKTMAREMVKTVTNSCWCSPNRAKPLGVAHSLFDNAPKVLRNILWEVEKSGPQDFLERIEKAHPELFRLGRFYREVGAHLQKMDGEMMLTILERLMKADCPALGIHDSVLVRKKDVLEAWEAMSETYFQFIGHKPTIHQVF